MRALYALPPITRRLFSGEMEHLLIDRGAAPIRIDVIEGTTAAGPVTVRFDLPDDEYLESRLAVVLSLRRPRPHIEKHSRLARRLLAVQATDARNAGATLREIAALTIGPGDWPGDGEYRKSMVRRLITKGDLMLRAGPRAVLAGSAKGS